jgi:hypothetical protein
VAENRKAATRIGSATSSSAAQPSATTRRGVYPGSFNPPTLAHIEIAAAAAEQHDLDSVDLAISRVALEKESVTVPSFQDRVRVVQQIVDDHHWLGLLITDEQLLVDIALGYDVLVMGADKWHQIQDPVFYDNDPKARDTAMAALPALALAPRPPLEVPADLMLDVPETIGEMSSSAARAGMHVWMHPRALAFDLETGAWSDQRRYLAGD